MSQLLTFLFVITIISCNSTYPSSTSKNSKIKIRASKIVEKPFDISLKLDQTKSDSITLVIELKLKNGSFIISPFSKDSIYGNLNISFTESSQLLPSNSILEIPKSIKEFDPIIDEQVNFVRENTTYKKDLRILTKNDFEVTGLIDFVLEPICIPYDVKFVISQKTGKVEIKKMRTSISKEFKL